ncbi:TadE family type IV pilus minor pilin [Agromyces silvae]|uniref:TadE family type IV pilus minor pilin n=1 Tax=Agromyces silvae TaxID=3388266 RepID=UPI00280BEA9D|nr:TadE family type IV pilus minor pilin [Agromyces protaetiae]
MTAELAVALPAVTLVLALCLGAVVVVGRQVRLTDAAADAARALGRGESEAVAHAIADRVAGGGTGLATSEEPPLICATLTASGGAGLLGAIQLRAESCAVAGGG